MDIGRRARIAVGPGASNWQPSCGASRWRWVAHFSLPFPAPTEPCIEFRRSTDWGVLKCGIHNHLRSVVFARDKNPPKRIVVQKSYAQDQVEKIVASRDAEARIVAVESPPALAFILQETECASAAEAFQNAEDKFFACFEALNNVIRATQARLPYSTAWSFRPVTFMEIGCAHHAAEYLCKKGEKPTWHPGHSFPIMSAPGSLGAPLHRISVKELDLDSIAANGSDVTLEDELLAEAIASYYAGSDRLVVLNSAAALENMANRYFKAVAIASLNEEGKSDDDAERQAESERKDNRNDLRHLLHRGPVAYGAASLHASNDTLYQQVLKSRDKRHDIIHRGEKATEQEAELAFRSSCEAIAWIQSQLGLPVRPYSCRLPGLAVATRG